MPYVKLTNGKKTVEITSKSRKFVENVVRELKNEIFDKKNEDEEENKIGFIK